ncbi:class I SAM-dependent methyltransferase [Streptomyces zingiberis]|uniref:Class I SAM-dependent methyltransferase n=1 Tax=Streptomyces zingiberis TaxID=2053010 RepID=A0ABX1BPQ1_9ACTN|nr:class I SAM-dependent methyltransferase [Streptomyces zingiberis]NJP99705.1 class I SAM-dependent methyltransferase [Streptomyces zingiberis]
MDAEAWDERYRGTELVWAAGPNRFVAAELAGLPAGRAVDLAAGEGRNAVWLAERGWEVDALDFSPVALAKADRLAAERGVAIRTVRADLTDPAAWERATAGTDGSAVTDGTDGTGGAGADGGYDLALVVYLHLPWPEMTGVLRRAATAVRPGGTLLLVGHHADNIEHGYGGPRYPEVLSTERQVAGAWRPYTRIVKAERAERPVETEDGTRVALDTLVRAERL